MAGCSDAYPSAEGAEFTSRRQTKRPTATSQASVLVKIGIKIESIDLRLPNAADSSETLLEFVDAAFRIDKLREASEERMRIRRNADRDYAVLNAINDFFLFRSLSRAANEPLASGHINKDSRIVFWMKVLFHENLEPYRVSDAAGGGE